MQGRQRRSVTVGIRSAARGTEGVHLESVGVGFDGCMKSRTLVRTAFELGQRSNLVPERGVQGRDLGSKQDASEEQQTGQQLLLSPRWSQEKSRVLRRSTKHQAVVCRQGLSMR